MNGIAAFVDRVAQRVDTASNDVAYQMTLSLRTFAISSGWPLNVANLLEVVVEDGRFVPAWPRAIAEVVRDLEYGVSTDDPNPVIRRFANRLDSMAYLRLNRAIA